MSAIHYRIVTADQLAEQLGVKVPAPSRLPHSPATMAVTYFHDNDGRCLGYASHSLDCVGGAEPEQCAIRAAGPEQVTEINSVWF